MAASFQRIDPASPVYQEFARLYRIAREMHPTTVDRWTGELYVRTDGLWGGFDPKTGSMRLSHDRVLAHLTGPSVRTDPDKQAEALATVLHEAYHARTELDAPNEPNAVRHDASQAFDEGFTERKAVNDFDVFATRAGYYGLELGGNQYQAAVEATDRLVDYAAGPDRQSQLLQTAFNKPVVMGWDTIADEIVRNKLRDVVPQDPHHQQAARAELVNAMAHSGWSGLHSRPFEAGRLVAHDTEVRLDAAAGRIRQHYRVNPGQPYPAVAPNRAAAVGLDGEQARMAQPVGRDPQVLASSVAHTQPLGPDVRGTAPSAQPALDPAVRAAFSGQVSPTGAVRLTPDLGDGARGRTGGSTHESGRNPDTPPERGDR